MFSTEKRLAMAIAEASSVLIWLSDTQKQCIYFNRAWLRYRGRTQEEEYGFGWAEGVHPEDYERCINIFTKAFDARECFSMDYRLLAADGSYGWIRDDGAPYYSEKDEFLGYIGSCYVVSESVELTQKLETTNLRLQEAVKAGSIGIWDWDVQNDVLVWDEQMYRLYGVEDAKGEEGVLLWQNALHPEDRDFAIQAMSDAIAGIKPYDVEFRLLLPSGETRYISANGTVFFDQDGRAIRMVGTNIDITERHVSLEKIRQLEKRNQSLLDYSPVCHKIVDLDYNLQFMNANGFRMLALSINDDHYGKPYPFQFFPMDAQVQMTEGLNRVVETAERISFESLACDSKGHPVWLFHTIVPIIGELGDIDFLTVVTADITEQKEVQAKLQHREKMDAIGQLAGGIAHDFNNQLASVMGNLELLKSEVHSEKGQRYIAKLLESTERSSALTKQMLTFSRKKDIIRKPVDLHVEIKNTIELMSISIDRRIQLKTELNATRCVVLGEPSVIQSSLLNLLINASHAIVGSGSILVRTRDVIAEEEPALKSEAKHTSSHYICVSVEDDGQGIEEAILPKIFDPFFTTKPISKGTGMGLASVYGAIKHHNGHIFVESEPGNGTTFHLFLPTESIDRGLPMDRHNDRNSVAPVPLKKTVLIADDEEPILTMCQEYLSERGFTVLIAENGEIAVNLYKQHWQEIDVVLLDLVMPVMDGREVFKHLASINPAVTVFVSTGFDKEGVAGELINSGVIDIIEKPFKLQQLYSLLTSV